MFGSRGPSKTLVLKSPNSDTVREVIVTSVLLPKSGSENIKSSTKCFRSNNESLEILMEKRTCKRRLDHLTLDEKILRKKLKNREAAQTSRDRKKARLEELEVTVLQLQNENEALREEVLSLREDKESLGQENVRLSEEVWRLSVAGGTSGPAVFCPLPQGVSPPPAMHRLSPSLLLHLLTWLISTSIILTGSTMYPSHPFLRNLNNSQILCLLKLMIQKKQKHRKKIWWGRRQKAWNPVGPV